MMETTEKIPKYRKLLQKMKSKYKTSPSPELKQKILLLMKHVRSKTEKINEPNKFSLKLAPPIRVALDEMGFVSMTPIQEKVIPCILENKDVLASAKTGSGKTLAFLVPLVEKIYKIHPKKTDGVQALIISPTKELTIQTCNILRDLTRFTGLQIGLVVAGGCRQAEYEREVRGCSILVATAGRLLDHLRSSPPEEFSLAKLRILVIDEADMLLDMGNGGDVRKILSKLGVASERQTLLFSATLSHRTSELAGIALRPSCVSVTEEGVLEKTTKAGASKASTSSSSANMPATVDTLQQGVVVCPPERRFCCLYAFLARNRSQKIMVFMSARMEVKFYATVLHTVGFPISAIYGTMTQQQRRSAMDRFTHDSSKVLLCTSIAARGLDIPNVDWILQYDPPDDLKEYIHRVGRTARGGASGNALLFLRPHELTFLDVLKEANVKVTELDFDYNLVGDSQKILKEIVRNDPSLRRTGKEAFTALVRGYSTSRDTGLAGDGLDLLALARSFGLDSVPKVRLPVGAVGNGEELSWAQVVSGGGRHPRKSKKSRRKK